MNRIIVASVLSCFAVFALCGSLAAKTSSKPRAQAEEQAPDSCKPGIWRNVSFETIDQISGLIKQYNAANDQLAKLGASATDTVVVSRRNLSTGYKIYEGDWNEVREALQAMLKSRLTGLACKLQALGIDTKQTKNSEISRR